MRCWKNEEILKLFKLIEKCKNEKVSLLGAFDIFSKMSGRNAFAVRNFYYFFLKNVSEAEARNLGINKSLHLTKNLKKFSKADGQLVVEKISKLVANGNSVRKSCNLLAQGDEKLMLRYQNKFRNTSKYGKIIKMPEKKSSLSDTEINSLFLGLVKLVKKCALDEADKKLKLKIQNANNELRQSLVSLATKDEELKILRKQFEILKNEKLLLKEELGSLRSATASYLNDKFKSSKEKNFQKFIQSISKYETTEVQS